MKPIGVAPALAIYQSLKTAGEELQHHDAGLEFGSVSRCYLIPNKERIINVTGLGIEDRVIF